MRRLQVVRSARAVRSWALLPAFLIIFSLAGPCSATHAAITVTGEVTPDAPDTWNGSSKSYVGKSANGSLTINSGSAVYSKCGYFGYNKGVTGNVSVDGTGSTWTNSNEFWIGFNGVGTLDVTNGAAVKCTNDSVSVIGYNYGSTGTVLVDGSGSMLSCGGSLLVGYSGNGTLNITNGGSITVADATCLARYCGSSGMINFGSNGGSLTTKMLDAKTSQLTGTGTINTQWLLPDVNMVFDSDHGLNQAFTLHQSSSQNITVNLNVTDCGDYDLVAGQEGNSSVMIRDGIKITSNSGYIGNNAGSVGSVTVDGAGSTWKSKVDTYVGYYGNGTLNICGGGTVSTDNAKIGYYSGSTGRVTVDGIGSTWTTRTGFYVGSGTMNITNGGSVINEITCSPVIGNGVVTIDGLGSSWISPASAPAIAVSGQLNIVNGGSVISSSGTSEPTVSGMVRINGAKSIWNNSGGLSIGNGGTFSITNGGTAKNSYTYIGKHTDSATLTSAGTIIVEGVDSSFANSGKLVVAMGGYGRVSITNGATLSSNTCIIGDSYYGYYSGTGTVEVNGTGSKWTNSTSLNIGNDGSGTLTIINGGAVTSQTGTIGYQYYKLCTTTGIVTVDGAGSTWSNTSSLCIGYGGHGTMNVLNGGAVSSKGGVLGRNNTWTGTGKALIDGAGSKWTNNGSLVIGESDTGTLSVTNGGAMTATSVSINSTSLLAMDAGNGSSLTVGSGSGTITNDGTIRISAGANIEAGIYKPILAGTWSGSGKVQAFGGAWDSIAHTFTAAAAQSGNAGETVVVNSQRLLIEGSNGQSVAVNFLADATPSTFKASVIDINTLNSLEGSLAVGQSVLSGWLFEPGDGYTEGNAVYLSLEVGAGQSLDSLGVWHFDGSTWTPYTVTDLTYDGTYANFSVTGFSGYAMSGITVPEPGAIVLLAVGLASMLAYVWSKRK